MKLTREQEEKLMSIGLTSLMEKLENVRFMLGPSPSPKVTRKRKNGWHKSEKEKAAISRRMKALWRARKRNKK